MIHLDTSVVIDALTGPRRSAPALRAAIAGGERIALCSLVLYEWLRGARHEAERHALELLFPRDQAVPFGPEEGGIAATLYATVKRPRGREIDLAIAACAITQGAALWTLNPEDFRDVPGLTLYEPAP